MLRLTSLLSLIFALASCGGTQTPVEPMGEPTLYPGRVVAARGPTMARDGGRCTIEVQVDLEDDFIEVRVIHDGDPIDTSQSRGDFDPVRLIKDRRKGGIGLVLMQRLMDQVDFRTTEDSRSECCLRKYK